MTLVNDVEENCYDISFSVSVRRFLLSKMVFRSILLFAFLYSYSDFDFDSTFYTFVFGRWVFASHLLLYRVCGIVLFAVLAACFSYYSVLNVKCWRVWNSGAIQFVMWTLLSASPIFVFRMFFRCCCCFSLARCFQLLVGWFLVCFYLWVEAKLMPFPLCWKCLGRICSKGKTFFALTRHNIKHHLCQCELSCFTFGKILMENYRYRERERFLRSLYFSSSLPLSISLSLSRFFFY